MVCVDEFESRYMGVSVSLTEAKRWGEYHPPSKGPLGPVGVDSQPVSQVPRPLPRDELQQLRPDLWKRESQR